MMSKSLFYFLAIELLIDFQLSAATHKSRHLLSVFEIQVILS